MSNVVYHPKQVVPRRTQLAVSHKIADQLGYDTRKNGDRTAYEAFLTRQIGKRSLKGATRHERNETIKALEAELQAKRGLTYAADDFSDESALEVLG